MKSRNLVLLLILFSFTACFRESKKLSEMEEYTGPSLEADSVLIYMTEASILKLIIGGNKQLTYQNGNQEFPETIRVDFFDSKGDTTSVLTAQAGSYDAKTKLYRAWGDVYVRNIKEQRTLKTEELFWDPASEKIFTDKFVIITTEDGLFQGTGLDAAQDFSDYTITKPNDSELIISEEGNENN